MVQPGFGGALDTPRTNIGDATYLSHKPDFADISQEASFQSPGKDDNLLQQLRNGRGGGGINLRTPRRSGPLADRINLPPSIGGAEFTPLLKSATRNSVRRHGKENGIGMTGTPGLGRADEDEMTLLPQGETSIYRGSRNQSYLDNTLPQVDASSAASTPMALPARRGGDKGPLQDGNQLSLREQENVIDRIEKENFGLKLKIHFLEEALRKAGPGFSEAAMKENMELKVDKVTMQRELHKYKKHLTTAEGDLEAYRQQMLELQEKAKRKYADESQRAELEKLRQTLEERESSVDELQRQVDEGKRTQDQVENLQDDIGDLEAELREKDRLITEREDELEDLKDKLGEAEEAAQDTRRKMREMEQAGKENEELEEAKETIESLELDIRRLEEQIDDLKEGQAEQDDQELGKAKETISSLESDIRSLEEQVDTLRRQQSKQQNEELEESKEVIESLELEIRRLELQIENMKTQQAEQESDELGEAREVIESLELDIRRLEAQIEDIRLEQAEQKKEKQAAQEKAEQHNEELQEATDTIESLELDIRHLEDQVETMKEKMDDAIAQKDRAEGDLEELQEEMANKSVVTKGLSRQIEEKIARLQQDLDKSGEEQAALERELSEANQDNDALRSTIKNLEDDSARRRTEVSGLRHQLTSAQQSISGRDKAGDEIIDLQRQLSESNQDNEQLRSTIQSLEDESARRRIEVSSLRHQLTLTQQSISGRDKAGDEVAEIERMLSESSQDNDKLRSTIKDLEDDSTRRRTEVSNLRQQLSSARQSISGLDKSGQYAALEKELSEVTQDNDKLRSTVKELEDGSSQNRTEVSSLRQQLASAQQSIVELKSNVRNAEHATSETTQDLQRQLDDMEDQKIVLEELLEEVRQQVKESETEHEHALRQMKRELDTELKSNARGAERTVSEATKDLQRQLDDLEDQKIVLEEVLEEARQHAEETAAEHEQALRLMKRELTKLQRERNKAVVGPAAPNDRTLRKTQAEIENLEHDVCQQQETIDALVASEGSLRRKLERARSERAAYRLSAEKLQRDVQKARKAIISGQDQAHSPKQQLQQRQRVVSDNNKAQHDEAIETVVRAAQGAEERHQKELKGMIMQMEWMQARWEREASLRTDAAFAKKYLQLQLDVANAWYVFNLPIQPLFRCFLALLKTWLTSFIVTKLNSASWSTSAPTSSATANLSWPPASRRNSKRTAPRHGPHSRHSSPWPASSPACASPRRNGLSKNRSDRGSSPPRRRCARRSGRGSSKWCVWRKSPRVLKRGW